MFELDFPYVATFVSTILAFGLGLLWYSLKVLGDRWMTARGASGGPPKPSYKMLAVSFVLWLIAACFFPFWS